MSWNLARVRDGKFVTFAGIGGERKRERNYIIKKERGARRETHEIVITFKLL